MHLDMLEDIEKARKAKGLDSWKKLEYLREKLEGKQASHITFTTSYPGQEGSKKHLGSATGNLQFLLGYVNPGFHVAPYHFLLVDPNMTPEEAAKMKHPANPRYWKESGLDILDEGDFNDGKPHPSARVDKNSRARVSSRKEGSVRVRSGYGSYIAVPTEGNVYSLTNGHVYKWGIVRESYLASTEPGLTTAMDDEYDEGVGEVEKAYKVERVPFHSEVYPLVKRSFPRPGSTFSAGKLKVLVKSDRIEFFDQENKSAYVQVYDRTYRYFDIKKGGDIHPSVLLQFASNYLNVNRIDLEKFVHDDDKG